MQAVHNPAAAHAAAAHAPQLKRHAEDATQNLSRERVVLKRQNLRDAEAAQLEVIQPRPCTSDLFAHVAAKPPALPAHELRRRRRLHRFTVRVDAHCKHLLEHPPLALRLRLTQKLMPGAFEKLKRRAVRTVRVVRTQLCAHHQQLPVHQLHLTHEAVGLRQRHFYVNQTVHPTAAARIRETVLAADQPRLGQGRARLAVQLDQRL
eukprot:1038195-Pleurochrysis_carterae.AAC.3